ncbi:ATP-binding protein [Patescibacteria group bacterium]|nr:ATP-binding protein [Patescibacteria group bacterium]
MFLISLPQIIIGLTVIVNSFISFVVYKRNNRSATNVIFALLGLTILAWLVTTSISFQPVNPAVNLFWIRLSTFFAPAICCLFLLFSLTVPNPKVQIRTSRFIILLATTYLVMLLIISPFTFTKVEIVNNFPNPSPGFGMPVFVLYVVATVGGSIYVLLKKLRSTAGVEKHQIKLIILGIISMPGLILFTNVIPILIFHNNSLVPLTPLLTLSFLSVTAYAIIRHRFFDIRFVIARSVSYTLLIVFFGVIYAFLFATLSSLFTTQDIQTETVTISAILALLMAFTFQNVKKVIEKYTDHYLYRDHYNASSLLYDLTLIMASTLKFEDLSHQFLKTLTSQMKISRAAIILADEDMIYDVAHEGFDKNPEYSQSEIYSLMKENKTIVFDELPEGKLKNCLRNLGIAVTRTISTAGEQIGLLTFGEKLSGDIYSEEDMRVVEIIVPEVAVAIKNALAYDEISKFNITLTQEVETATADLRKANDKLRELDKLKDEFVSMASHELRTPMTAVKNYLWLALDKLSKTNPEVTEYLNIASTSTNRLLKLVEDMLTISRIEGKRLVLEKGKVNLNQLLKEVFNEVKVNGEQRKVHMELELDGKIFMTLGDKEKLREVVQNILGNAIKFTPSDGKIIIGLIDKDEEVAINIFNSGTYISPEDKKKLFEKFRRLKESEEQQVQGTGLGLYITKQIIEMHKGRIDVESEQNKGTSFIIYLPKTK